VKALVPVVERYSASGCVILKGYYYRYATSTRCCYELLSLNHWLLLTLNLLARSIEQAEATDAATDATIQEIRGNLFYKSFNSALRGCLKVVGSNFCQSFHHNPGV